MASHSELNLILRAAHFAARKHRDQRRKNNGSPYINHPLSVARRLVDVGRVDDPITVAAALLHDTIEDTNTTHDEIVSEFGADVAAVVDEVTDDKSQPKGLRKRGQIQHALEISTRAKTVKLADKLDNLTEMTISPPKGWDVQRIRGYFVWAFTVVENLRGANEHLEGALDRLFTSELNLDGESFCAVPEDDAERKATLQSYLGAMDRADD